MLSVRLLVAKFCVSQVKCKFANVRVVDSPTAIFFKGQLSSYFVPREYYGASKRKKKSPYYMNVLWECYVKWNILVIAGQTLYDSTYMR